MNERSRLGRENRASSPTTMEGAVASRPVEMFGEGQQKSGAPERRPGCHGLLRPPLVNAAIGGGVVATGIVVTLLWHALSQRFAAVDLLLRASWLIVRSTSDW